MAGSSYTGLVGLLVIVTGAFGSSLHYSPVVNPWKIYNQSRVEISDSDSVDESIPASLPEYVTHLRLSNNNIKHISASTFSNLKNLETLEVVQNPLWEIENGSFSNLVKLEALSLSCKSRLVKAYEDDDYPYPHLTASVFRGLDGLARLKLMIIGIDTLYRDFFEHVRNLRALCLVRNPIRTVDSDAFEYLDKLESLDLSYTFISQLHPDTFRKLTRLKVLDMFPTRLLAIPSDALSPLTSLRILTLGGNFSSYEFKEPVKNLTSLQRVTLRPFYAASIFEYGETEIELVTGAFDNLRTKSLIVDENRVRVTQRLVNLFSPFLKSLSCSGVTISDTAPNVIVSTTLLPEKLVELNLSKNKLTQISVEAKTFSHLGELRVLNLSSNAINQFHKDSFWGLRKLEVLDLSDNNLEIPSMEALKVFSNQDYSLRVLNISGNRYLTDRSRAGVGILGSIFNISTLRELVLVSMDLRLTDTFISVSLCHIPHLKDLKLRNNLLHKFDLRCLQQLKSLKSLDLAYNLLNPSAAGVPYTFSNLKKLEYLNLCGQRFDLKILKGALSIRVLVLMNGKSTKAEDFWDNTFNSNWQEMSLYFPNMAILVLAHTHISFLSRVVLDSFPNVRQLRLHDNELTYLDMSRFRNMTQLRYLDMSGNKITTVNGSLWHLPNLHTLLLARNGITSIPESFLDAGSLPALRVLDLRRIAFNCDCQLSWFRKWAQRDRVVNVVEFTDYQCSYHSRRRDNYVKDFNPWLLDCESLLHVYLSVSLACAAVVVAIVAGLCLYNRWYIRYAYFLCKIKMKGYHELVDLEEKQKPFDAFVSYNSEDEEWVSEVLLHHLETGGEAETDGRPRFKICVDFNNFIPGKPIIENIVDSIQNSRKTILVLTPNFVKSEWCYFEMQIALNQLFDEGRDVVILVLLEPIADKDLPRRLRRLFTKKTYIEWPKEERRAARRLFWAKLEDALKIPTKVDRIRKE